MATTVFPLPPSHAEAGVVMHPGLQVRHSPSAGYHIVATRDLPAGELLLSVPWRAVLNLDPSSDSRLDALLQAGCPPLCASALLLAEALAAGSQGPLGAHAATLQGLPEIGNIVQWGARERRLLQATSLHESLHTMPLGDRFRTSVAPFLAQPGRAAQFPALAAASSPSGGVGAPLLLSEHAFLRAATLIMSRCFHNSGGAPHVAAAGGDGTSSAGAGSGSGAQQAPPVLVPVADFFNHSPTRPHTRNARVGDDFRFYALRDVCGGAQVFLSYGALSDGQLLHTYGFTPEPEEEEEPEEDGGRGDGEVDGGGAPSPPLLRAVCSPAWNPHNSVTIPAVSVVACLRGCVVGGGRTRAGKQFTGAVDRLVHLGLLPPHAAGGASPSPSCGGGFALCMPQDAVDAGAWGALAGHDAASTSAPASASPSSLSHGRMTRGQSLEALVPHSLLTVVQLLTSGDDASLDEYVAACGAAGGPVMLPVPSPSTLMARLEAQARAGAGGSNSREPGGGDGDVGYDDQNEDGDVEPDDVLSTWEALLAVLAQALRGYPSSLKSDTAWYLSVRSRRRQQRSMAASGDGAAGGGGTERGSRDGGEPSRKRQRTGPNAGADEADEDPWSWPVEKQVDRGVCDHVYRGCRLLALREKQLLAAAIAAIDAELKGAVTADSEEEDEEEEEEDGDEGGEASEDDGVGDER